MTTLAVAVEVESLCEQYWTALQLGEPLPGVDALADFPSTGRDMAARGGVLGLEAAAGLGRRKLSAGTGSVEPTLVTHWQSQAAFREWC